MKHLRLFGILIIATHCLVAVWHLLLAPAVLPDIAHFALATPIDLIVAAGRVVFPQRTASVRLLVLFGVALPLGTYEHFLGNLPNNIFRLSASPGVVAFRISSMPLFFLELSAGVLALYQLTNHQSLVTAFVTLSTPSRPGPSQSQTS